MTGTAQQVLLDRLEAVSLSPHALALCRMEYLQPNDNNDDVAKMNHGLAQELALLLRQAVEQQDIAASTEDAHLLQIMQILQNITQTDATLAEESACCEGSKDCYATIIQQQQAAATGSSAMLDLATAMMADVVSHDSRTHPFSKTDLESRLPRLWVVPQTNDTAEVLELLVHPVTTGQTEQHDVGFVMWPSSVVLSRYIANHPSLVLEENGNILELGAGCGLVGLTAARLLQQQKQQQPGKTESAAAEKKVIFTDYNPTVLKNISRNVRLNDLGQFTSVTGLDFCDQITREEVVESDSADDAGWIDMEGQHQPQVGLILAADVICYSNDATMVADTIKAALIKGGTAIVVSADENRRFGVEHFPEACYQAGLEVETTHIVADKKGTSNDEEDMLVDDLQNTTGFTEGYNLIMFTITAE